MTEFIIGRQTSRPMDRILIFVSFFMILCYIGTCHTHSNGGTICATCTVVMGLVEQTSVIHNESLIHSMERICNYLPGQYQKACKVLANFTIPIILEILEDHDTPDIICYKIGLCYTEKGRQCNLFPLKTDRQLYKYSEDSVLSKMTKQFRMANMKADICGFFYSIPELMEICYKISQMLHDHMPIVDKDGDKYSTIETLRGFSWRGKDCNDHDSSVHPGARTLNGDAEFDSNCNGIKGKDSVTGASYEDMFCSQSSPRGVAVLSDSTGAHFHLPREWFNSSEISTAVFKELPYILENELDWPELSFVTGYMNATDTLRKVIHGYTDSIYLRLWNRNRCNFRDYQNIAVNGTRYELLSFRV